jgi:peptidoglycan/xylan/chitin deacetylase (PgdA/CDA1 family)
VSAREGLKIAVLRLARALGLFTLSRRLTRRAARILCYHGAWISAGTFSRYLFMTPARFRSRLDLIARLGLPVLPLDEAVRRLADGTLPDCATVITIDDGWYGTGRDMLPELARRGLPATLYLTTYYAERQLPVFDVALQFVLARAGARTLDLAAADPALAGRHDLGSEAGREAAGVALRARGRTLNGAGCAALLARVTAQLGFDLDAQVAPRQFHLMTMEEVRAAAAQGADFQLHTHRHRLATDGLDALAAEIAENRARLAAVTDRPLAHFCYPSGAWTRDAWPVLERLGILSATTTEQGLAWPGDPPLGLARITDGEDVHELEIEAELCGFAELVRRARQPSRPARHPPP